MEEIRFLSSNEIDLVSQTDRFLAFQIPLHKQHTLRRNILARFEVIYIPSVDLVWVQIYRKSLISALHIAKHIMARI